MNKTLTLHTFLLVLLALAPLAQDQIEVTSITASPDPFNPDVGETTTVTVNATPGLTILELRVFQSDQVTLMQSGLALTETTAGVYTAVWEGKYPAATTGIYYFRVLNKATSTYAGPWGQVAVQGIHHQAVADAGVGESIFHRRFHGFLASRATVAVDDMLCHFRPRLR